MSANLRQVEILIKKNIIKKSSCSDFVTNGLAIVGPADSKEKIKTIGDLVNVKGRISIGMPEHCPVGTYAKEALESAGIFDRIQSRIVYADTVRQIVRYAQTGNITAGFVYTSDAMLFKDQIRLFCLVDSSLHRPVKYAVVVPAEKKRKALDLYFDFIYSERGMKILSDFGFFQDKSN
jgi:molybdate transport system substrate-binding protein